MTPRMLYAKLVSIGFDRAPAHERGAVRRLNERVIGDALMSLGFNLIWAVCGAWKMFALSMALSTISPVILLCNHLGFRLTARFLVSLSFAVCIAMINFFIGTWTQADVLFFASLAAIAANFRADEKLEMTLCFLTSVALTLGSHFLALGREPILAVPEGWQPWIVAISWTTGTLFLITQISIFVKSVQRSQERLRESEELHSAVFNSAATGLNILSADGRYLKSNPEMCRILGMQESEIIGKRTFEITAPEDIARAKSDMAKLQRREIETLSKQKKYLHKSGRFIQANLQTRGLYHPNGELRYLISSVQDLTESKLAEQKLLQASKMSSLGEMAGSIAHEINTPLATMLLSAERLEDAELRSQLSAEQVSAIASTIAATVLRVAKIVRGLKAFARNADQDPMEDVRVHEVIADGLELCKEKFKNRGIQMIADIQPDLFMTCRPTQIAQVLLNLLSNAIDAIETTVPEQRWVKIEAQVSDSRLVLRVIDSGRGMPSAVAERILEPFFTTKPVGQGTGLGLSVSKGIIESHGGRFSLDRTHENTCFVIELPVRAAGSAAA